MKSILLMLIFATTLLAEHPKSFTAAKKAMYSIWSQHPYTFYCDCSYDKSNKKSMIDRKSCGYIPRNEFTKKGKINKRARRTEAEHVVPAENFYRQLACSRTSKKERSGKSKRDYCYAVNPTFRAFHDDPMNLVPAVGELNADRSNRRYGALVPQSNQYGECKFEVDFKNNKAYIKKDIQGDIARIYFYVKNTYGMKISSNDMKILRVWDRQDPIDSWEKKRLEIIKRLYN